jgi:hypothetical protein
VTLAKFVIAAHMRVQEWIARDRGYFNREGRDIDLSA